ncbi:MAG: hypothetical protein ACP5R4_12755 [Armatimonadota bacterium]
MKCDQAGQYLAELSVGGLGWFKRVAVWWHLRRCALCRSELARLNRVDALLKKHLQAPTTPPDLWETIRAGLDRQSDPRPVRRSSVSIKAWPLAAAVVVAVLTLVLLRVRTGAPEYSAQEASEYERQYVIAGWRDPLADQATTAALWLSSEK